MLGTFLKFVLLKERNANNDLILVCDLMKFAGNPTLSEGKTHAKFQKGSLQ